MTLYGLKTLIQGFLYKNKETWQVIQEIASKYTNKKVFNTKKTANKSGRFIAFQHASE